MLTAMGLSTTLLYLAAFALLLRALHAGAQVDGWAGADMASGALNLGPVQGLRGALIVWGIALLAHFAVLLLSIPQPDGANVCLFNAFSVAMWLLGGILWLSTLRHPLGVLGLLVLPFSALATLATLLCIGQSTTVHRPELAIHILFAALGWAFLALSTVQALTMLAQHRALHHRPPRGWVRLLPPLFSMEVWLFRTLLIGWLLLGGSLVSGFLFLEDLLAQHLVHKTVLSIAAWALFGTVLVGRQAFGWRGKKAATLISAGFVLLVLAYFGSKLVVEQILRQGA